MDWPTLLPLLVHIQVHLDEDLGLAALSRKAGYSPFHLQRAFQRWIGETPKSYVERLRLERSAFRLLVQDASHLEVALACGFARPETFIRAFRRRFGCSPGSYQRRLRAEQAAFLERRRLVDEAVRSAHELPAVGLSATRVVRLQPLHLAFRRHVGPYENVPESLFDELADWAARRGLPGPPVWLGLGHDAPGITPPGQLRFDAALVVPGPFAPEGEIAHQRFPGGDFALTTHAGPYDSLPAAYAAIFPRVLALPGWELVGLPVVEIYQTTRINVRERLNHTDLCLPVLRKGRRGSV